uniref:Uncharacterized protein n=1 Tax=Rhizophora mucronata TaxID=61149 RepID=A0A2P2Q8H5_RHIMU
MTEKKKKNVLTLHCLLR